MPPKKKKEVKEPVKPIPDDLDYMEGSRLKPTRVTQRLQLNELRKNRNYYLKERNQFAEFNAIVHKEVLDLQANIRNIEAQMEYMQDTHRKDIKIYLQKVINLEYEHATEIASIEKDAHASRQNDESKHLQKKEALRREKLLLKSEIDEDQRKYEEEIRIMRMHASKELEKLKATFEQEYQAMIASSEKRLTELKDDMELRRKMEIHEIEERKNFHITVLLKNHEDAFNLMRQYYNAITRDNLELIKALNTEIEQLKAKHEQNLKLKEEYSSKNRPLALDLQKEEEQVKLLRHELKDYAKQKVSLKHARAGLAALEQSHAVLHEEYSALQVKYAKAKVDRDNLYRTFEETVLRVRGRSDTRNRMLENMLGEYKDTFESKKAQFTAVLRQSNLDPAILHNVTQKLDDVLTAKNDQIKELKYDCAKVTKAHNDLVRVYEDKLRGFGIPESELDLEPLVELDPQIAGAGTVPAGLIVS